MMEHRISTRKAVSVQVALYCDRVGMLRCETRNISLEGMFVETGNISIPMYVPVEAVFITNHDDKIHTHRLQAHVVRSESDGVGLMFQEVDMASFRFLRELMYFEPPSAQ